MQIRVDSCAKYTDLDTSKQLLKQSLAARHIARRVTWSKSRIVSGQSVAHLHHVTAKNFGHHAAVAAPVKSRELLRDVISVKDP